MGKGIFSGVFHDKRLDTRCEQIFLGMVSKKSAVLHKSMPNRSALIGAYRFMNHKKVSYEPIRDCLTTFWPMAGKSILCLQDTSELNFSWHSNTLKIADGHIGPVGNNEDAGFFMHPSLCLDMRDGFPLGFSDVFLYNRSWQKADKQQRNYKNQPIEDKESYRWIERAQESKGNLQQADYVLFISDRESDIFELFDRLPDEKSDVLIRLGQDRLIYDTAGNKQKLSEKLAGTQPFPLELPIAKSGQRKKQLAKLEVKFASVQIARPKNGAKQAPRSVPMAVIEAKQQASNVAKGEEAILWRLITSRQVESLQQAVECLQYYGLRWRIEELIGLVKSQAMEVEQSQLNQGKALKTTVILALQAALQIMQLKEGRNKTDQPARLAFTAKQLTFMKLLCQTLQGKTVKQQNPFPENSMAYAAWIIGRLGGWKGLYSQGPPGVRSFAWGLKIFQQQFEGFLLGQKFSSS
jgi:hypothetical protein